MRALRVRHEINVSKVTDWDELYSSILRGTSRDEYLALRSAFLIPWIAKPASREAFGFVTMGNVSEGNAAIKGLHGKDKGGRKLTVNEARPKDDRGGHPSPANALLVLRD